MCRAENQRVAVIVDPFCTAHLIVEELSRRLCPIICVISSTKLPSQLLDQVDPAPFVRYVEHVDLTTTLEILNSFSVKSVISGWDTGVCLAEELQSALGVSSHSSRLRRCRTDKYAMQNQLRRMGLQSIRQLRSAAPDECIAWARSWPVVVKPVGGRLGIQKGIIGPYGIEGQRTFVCWDENDVRRAFLQCSWRATAHEAELSDAHSHTESSALNHAASYESSRPTPGDSSAPRENSRVRASDGVRTRYGSDASRLRPTQSDKHNAEGSLLCQEFLHGTEYAVNCVSAGGTHMVLSIWEKKNVQDGATLTWKTTSAHLISSRGDVQDRMRHYLSSALDALGIENGPSHNKVIMVDGNPHLLDVKMRLPGFLIPSLTLSATGFGDHELVVDILCGASNMFHRMGGSEYHYICKKLALETYLDRPTSGVPCVFDVTTLRKYRSFFDLLILRHTLEKHVSDGEQRRNKAGCLAVIGAVHSRSDDALKEDVEQLLQENMPFTVAS
eukprot:GEMP01008890.1.p1 GENE.GEMP01008890.1~~GEMP01008890.1.p1  ORF type:complete len:501 (+),score=98.96 GEMP01008890.1:264-1766(+)